MTNFSQYKWYQEKKDFVFKLFLRLNMDERNVITYLLKKFLVHNSDELIKQLVQILVEKFLQKVSVGNVLLTGVKMRHQSESSDWILYFFRLNLGLKNHKLAIRHFDALPEIVNYLRDKNITFNILLLDDFIGTGGYVIDYLAELERRIPGISTKHNIFVGTIVVMSNAIERILGRNVKEVISCVEIRKGISDAEDLSITEKQKYKDTISAISAKNYLNNSYTFGYKESEALYSGANTPNNTFGIFWQRKDNNGKEFPAIFPRSL